MIRRLDTRLIAMHQHVVDLAQRQPRWLSEQCVIGLAVLSVLRVVLVDGMSWWIVFQAMVLAMLLAIVRFPPLFAAIGAAFFTRMWFLAWLVVRGAAIAILLAAGPEVMPAYWLGLLGDITITAYVYFAACKPPRPRVPRTRMAHAGGGV